MRGTCRHSLNLFLFFSCRFPERWHGIFVFVRVLCVTCFAFPDGLMRFSRDFILSFSARNSRTFVLFAALISSVGDRVLFHLISAELVQL